MSEPFGVWNAKTESIVYVDPPKLRMNLLTRDTPLGEVPPEWSREVEWRVHRPYGWGNCWFIWSRTRGKQHYDAELNGEPTTWPENPMCSVQVWNRNALRWESKSVRIRPWIANIFYEWDSKEPLVQLNGYRTGSGKEVILPARSDWEVAMVCGNDACINPAHFRFEQSRRVDSSARWRRRK